MDQIIIAVKAVPWWAYIVFVYVLVMGLTARYSRVVSVKKTIILPLVIFAWSIYGIIANFGRWWDPFVWILFFVIGCIQGFRLVSSMPIRADRKKFLIKVPGTNFILLLALIIIAAEYFFGFYKADYAEVPAVVNFSRLALSGVIAGIFFGRVYCYLKKFSKAHHEKLKKKK